jgi:hypothetical protein
VRVFFPHLSQIPIPTTNPKTTHIRFGKGSSVAVVEPLDEIMDRLNKTNWQPEG